MSGDFTIYIRYRTGGLTKREKEMVEKVLRELDRKNSLLVVLTETQGQVVHYQDPRTTGRRVANMRILARLKSILPRVTWELVTP